MTEQIEIVSVKGGKYHRPDNTLFDGNGSDFRNPRLMRCGRSLVPLNFYETITDADRYTGGQLATYICQQCEAKVSHLWRVPAVLENGNPQPKEKATMSITTKDNQQRDLIEYDDGWRTMV